MRLGILPLGPLSPALAFDALAERLRAADVDVITPAEPLVAEHAIYVVSEAERLARADCDGILLLCPDAFAARDLAVRCALALAPHPLLLAGALSRGLLEAVGALEEIGGGLAADRLPVPTGSTLGERAESVRAWLDENERRERDRGSAAARQVARERLLVVGRVPDGTYLDPLQWAGQFGVTLSTVTIADVAATALGHSREAFRDDIIRRSGDGISGLVLGADYPEGWDSVLTAPPVYARGGDMDGALTHCVLRHLTEDGAVWSAGVFEEYAGQGGNGTPQGDGSLPPDPLPEEATFARLRRVGGRYVCDLFTGHVSPDGEPRFGADAGTLAGALGAGRIHYLPGRHAGAVRAACRALDIPVRRVQTSP